LTEQNTHFFDIQRASDGKNFASIGRVEAAGNSVLPINYSFNDNKTVANIAYYRLVTVDLDGTKSVSNVLTLRKNASTKSLTLFPSLVQSTLNLTYASDNSDAQWRIIDGLGAVVRQFSVAQNTSNAASVQTESHDVSGLNAGVYFVQLIQGNTISSARFFKTN
jgi:hypothetical protein